MADLHSQQVVVERTDIVRKRACPSSSEVLAGFREEEGLSLLLRGTPRHCEEEGRGANPSSSRRTQRHC